MRKWFKFCFLLVLSASLCGCWDSKPLERMVYPLSGGFDFHVPEENEEFDNNYYHWPRYDISIVLPELDKSNGGENSNDISDMKVETISGWLPSYVRNVRGSRNDRPYYTGQAQAMVYSQEVARAGLRPLLDLYNRDPIVPGVVQMVISAGSSREILSTKVHQKHNPALYISEMMQNAPQNLFITNSTLYTFLMDLEAGKNPVIPVLKKEGEHDLALCGLAIFDKDRMIDMVDLDQSRILIFLRGIKGQGYLPFQIKEEDRVLMEGTILAKNKRKIKVYAGEGTYKAEIIIQLSGRIVELVAAASPYQKLTREDIRTIEKAIETWLLSECHLFIRRLQEDFRVDCIDISRYFLAQDRHKSIPNIDCGFITQVQIEPSVKVTITDQGDIK
jgi:Ger(x)C family germination protein